MNALCSWYSRGIREVLVRQQVLEALTERAKAMADLLATTPAPEPKELLQLRSDHAALLALQRSGVPALEASIEVLQRQIDRLCPLASAPRADEMAAAFSRLDVLALATEAELRALVIEFVAAIRFEGNPRAVRIELG